MKSNYKLFLIACIITTNSCMDKVGFVETKMWKYCGGYWFGDVIYIEKKSSRIYKDTLFIKEKPFAIIDKIERRFFTSNVLKLKSLTKNSVGRYCEK